MKGKYCLQEKWINNLCRISIKFQGAYPSALVFNPQLYHSDMPLLTPWGSKISFPNPCSIDCQSYLLLFLTSTIFCLVTPSSFSELVQVRRTLWRHNTESKNLYCDHSYTFRYHVFWLVDFSMTEIQCHCIVANTLCLRTLEISRQAMYV
jgi:hypothetical protein